MTNMEIFRKAFARAKERKEKQQATVEKVIHNTSKTTTTNIIASTNTDRLCKATIIDEMTALIKQRKMK